MPFGQARHVPPRDASLLVADLCNSPSSCDEVAMSALQAYTSAFAATGALRCCSKVAHNLATADSALDAANGFLAGCAERTPRGESSKSSCWTAHDANHYYNATWLPTARLGGSSCGTMTRFGPAFGPRGDGGKTICEAQRLFSRPGCLVVSVGLNADTRFESALHAAHSGCDIIGMDHTLDAQKEALLPQFMRYLPRKFTNKTWTNYAGRSVRLLKLDCDGCEFFTLPSWVANVCTDQVVVEVHRWQRMLAWRPRDMVYRVHLLMEALAPLYTISFVEANPSFPKLNTEYTFVRRTPCS